MNHKKTKHLTTTVGNGQFLVYSTVDGEIKTELMENNKRRPRMLDVLNSLDGRRTRIVQ